MEKISTIGLHRDVTEKVKKPHFDFVVEGEGLVRNKVGAEYTACVGQLTTHHATCDVPILAVHWSVQGETLKSYNLSPDAPSLPIYLTGSDLQRNPLSFYWIEGGTYTVSVTIYTAYGWGTVQHTFNVTSPTITKFNSDTGSVKLVDYTDNPAIAFVSEFGEIGEGIMMQLEVQGNQNLVGQIATIQLIKTARQDQLDTGQNEHFSINGQWVLDNGRKPGSYIYSGPVQLNPGDTASLVPSDGPLQGMKYPPITQMNINKEEYKMYVMFKPNCDNSIWVPLRLLSWFWQGTATHSAEMWNIINADNSQNPDGGPVDSPPGWVSNVKSGRWITF